MGYGGAARHRYLSLIHRHRLGRARLPPRLPGRRDCQTSPARPDATARALRPARGGARRLSGLRDRRAPEAQISGLPALRAPGLRDARGDPGGGSPCGRIPAETRVGAGGRDLWPGFPGTRRGNVALEGVAAVRRSPGGGPRRDAGRPSSVRDPRAQGARGRRPRGGIGVAFDIRMFGDPVLKTRAAPVETFDDALAHLAEEMLTTMREHEGVGLAANQVGRLRRILVAATEDEEYVIVNPQIEEAAQDTEKAVEGCLS